MRIAAIILENFRSYKALTRIPISSLTGIIGKNDAGKSTILEALDIFFEGKVIKIEPSDASKGGDAKNVRIGVVFEDFPAELILDSNALTTLAAEHLLNEDGQLEVHKIYNCQNQTPRATIFAQAVHPTAVGADEVLQKTQAELRKIVKERGLENNCNQAANPSMRQAIYDSFGELAPAPRLVPLNDQNGKAVWTSLQSYMPVFALFQSDRPSSDQDPEVQNPMKLAIERALDELEPQLEAITTEVHRRAQETAQRTLDKLSESYPAIANTLEPKFKKPPWKNIFKLDLEADDGIPLNKRGSGVRRLVLMSFFQAEAEKRRADAQAGQAPQRRVVYAIEEPETSQHPDSQEQIIRALRALSEAGDQVILTTHVPALAALIPLESLRFVDRDPASDGVRVRSGSEGENVYEEVAATLGVLPDPLAQQGIKVAVLVEGKTDIDALQSMVQVLLSDGTLAGFDEQYVFWTIGGGDNTLQDWVERRYLDRLNVPQVMIQDSDRTNAALPVAQKKTDWLAAMQAKPNTTAFLTQKRSMDNYFHPDALGRLTGGIVTIPAAVDLDFVKMAEELSQHLTQARNNANQNGYSYQPEEHDGTAINGTSKGACKRIICAHIIRNMTPDELRQRSQYQDGAVTRDEVLDWINAIQAHL